MTKRQKQLNKMRQNQARLQVAFLNEYPVRFMDVEQKQPVFYGEARYESAPYEASIIWMKDKV